MDKARVIWLLPLLFALYIYFQEFTGPYAWDSMEYGFVEPGIDADNPYRPIRTPADLLVSQSNHYRYENGRVVVHGVIQPLSAIKTRWVFPLLDAFMYLLFVALILKLLRRRAAGNNVLAVSILAFLYVLPIDPDIAYQVNYLWVATLMTGFIMAFFRCRGRQWWVWPLLVLLGFAAGESNEAFAVGIGVAVVVTLIKRGRNIEASQIVLAATFFVGFCVNVLAPGNRAKFFSFEAPPFFKAFLNLVYYNWYLIVLAVVLLMRRRHGYRLERYLRRYRFLILAFCGEALLLLIMRTTYFSACLGLRWLLMLMLAGALVGMRLSRTVKALMIVVCLLSACYYGIEAFQQGKKYDYLGAAYLRSANGTVTLPSYLLCRDYRKTDVKAGPLTWMRRSVDPEAPSVRVLPENVATLDADADTNIIWRCGNDTYVFVQSRRSPRPFYLLKRLHIGSGKPFAVRSINLDKNTGIDYWAESRGWRAGVYHNIHPLLFKAEVTDSLPEF